ncbi:hypothetical protein [Bosea sp. LjRoot237]|uniref:hypothetical protein n=1 Tax=Bosea sp. LjRoot237 TaxID=3342292 RepID=UPI003ECCB313
MIKRCEIEIGPNDILIPDIDDALIESFRWRAELMGRSFSDYVLDILARGADIPRERLANASVIVLDDDA